jgi:hypothetical protein
MAAHTAYVASPPHRHLGRHLRHLSRSMSVRYRVGTAESSGPPDPERRAKRSCFVLRFGAGRPPVGQGGRSDPRVSSPTCASRASHAAFAGNAMPCWSSVSSSGSKSWDWEGKDIRGTVRARTGHHPCE